MPKELVLILVVLGGGAFVAYNWVGPSPLFHSMRGAVNVEPPPTGGKDDHKAPSKTAESKIPRKGVDGSSGGQKTTANPLTARAATVSPATDTTVHAAPTPAANIVAERPFPTPESLKMDMTAIEVRARFGPPALAIASTSEGRVMERYYYMSRDRSQVTLMTVENGFLRSVRSIPSAYFQLPDPADIEHGKTPPVVSR